MLKIEATSPCPSCLHAISVILSDSTLSSVADTFTLDHNSSSINDHLTLFYSRDSYNQF